MMVCEFTSISSISFDTTNVKSSGLFVDGESYYGAVDQFGVKRFSSRTHLINFTFKLI